MNEKQAKKLRRMAERMTPDKYHATRYSVHPRSGSIYCHPTCLRATYNALKKEVRTGT